MMLFHAHPVGRSDTARVGGDNAPTFYVIVLSVVVMSWIGMF